MQQVAKQGITPKELSDLIEMPESLVNCWLWFVDLHRARNSGFGVSAIPYSEIHSYFNLLQIQVEPWEIELIKLFDGIALPIISEQQAKENQRKK